MATFLEEYTKRIPTSLQNWQEAAKIIPGGVGSSIQLWAPGPIVVKEAKGAYVWDLDGNRYIDYSMCFAAMVAGVASQASGLVGWSSPPVQAEPAIAVPVMRPNAKAKVNVTLFILNAPCVVDSGLLQQGGASRGPSPI